MEDSDGSKKIRKREKIFSMFHMNHSKNDADVVEKRSQSEKITVQDRNIGIGRDGAAPVFGQTNRSISSSFLNWKSEKNIGMNEANKVEEDESDGNSSKSSFGSFEAYEKKPKKKKKKKAQAQIAIKGLQNGKESLPYLKEKGFIVYLAIDRGDDIYDVAIGMNPQLNKELGSEERSPEWLGKRRISLRVLVSALEMIKMLPNLTYEDCFLLHNPVALKYIKKHHSPDDIAEYFGSGIGMYFCFLKFYTDALLVVAISGVILLLSQMFYGHDSCLGPLFCIGVALWSTLFLELWKRRSSETAYRWGVHGAENEQEVQALASHKEAAQSVPIQKYLVTVPIIMIAIGFCINVMLSCVHLSQRLGERFGESSILRFFPMLAYSVVPIICSTAYLELASKLNDFEGHKTEKQRVNALTFKLFAFQFVNFFSALFYIGFYLMDMQRLSGMLISLSFARQITGNSMEAGYPILKDWLKSYLEKRPELSSLPEKVPLLSTIHLFTSNAKIEKPEREEVIPFIMDQKAIKLEEFLTQLEAPTFKAADEYLEMVIQFGFCTLFAVAFPLAPLFAYLNNLVEYQIDLRSLLRARRPKPIVASSIGSWLTCLEAVGYVATLTNCCLLVYLGNALNAYIPDSVQPFMNRTEIRILLALGLEHLLLAVKFVVSEIVDDEPLWVIEAVAQNQIRTRNAMKRLRLMVHGLSKLSHSIDDPREVQKNYAIVNLKNIYQNCGAWSFNPLLYAPLVVLPYLTGFYGLSSSWIGPIAAMLVGYMQHKKDDSDEGLATGEVKDANILRLIHNEVPSWFQDSDIERADWMSKLMQHIWAYVRVAAEGIIKSSVDPLLEFYKPSGIEILRFKKIDLGTVAPKVVGIKMLDTNETAAILDLESVWAGNPNIVVEVGFPSFTIDLTLSTIRFSGKIRAELSPLVPMVPCFGSLSISLMEMPNLDYSFKVGPLDVMALGAENAGVAMIVSNITKMILEGLMLYPNKLEIPIMYDSDVKGFETPAPKGILQIEMIGADNLRKADVMGKSDPYTIITLGADVEKTKIIKSDLNPRWHEMFDMIVYNKMTQNVKFSVFDDDIDEDDFLGECELSISNLVDHKPVTLSLPLLKTTSGHLLVKLLFIPLERKENKEEETIPDIIFDIPATELTDNFVNAEQEIDLSDIGQQNVFEQDTILRQQELAKKSGNFRAPVQKLKGAIKAVATVVTLGSHAVPAEPHGLIDNTDQSMGIFRIANIHVEGIKPAKVYCVIKQGNSVRETSVSRKGTEANWMVAIHMLIRASKTAQVEISLMEERSFGDQEIGICKIRISELVHNDNQLEVNQPLEGEKVNGTIKFRATWIPAMEQPDITD